jgi:hypothetical protein
MEGSGFPSFREFVEKKFEKSTNCENDIDEIVKCSNLYIKPLSDKIYKDYLKSIQPKKKAWMYLTLSPDKKLRNLENTKENRDELYNWCLKWFNKNPEFYPPEGDMHWIIEAGSEDNHLHVHSCFELKTGYKHAKKLKASWKRTFPNNQLLTSVNLCNKNHGRGEYAYAQITDVKILKDKLTYFDPEQKGDHENLVDLGLGFQRGFNLTD